MAGMGVLGGYHQYLWCSQCYEACAELVGFG